MSTQTDCILLYRTPKCGCEAGTSLSSELKVKTVCKIILFKKIKVQNFVNFMVRSGRRKSFSFFPQSIRDFIKILPMQSYTNNL